MASIARSTVLPLACLAFTIAGRPDNYYWGAVIAPPMFLGLVFAVPGFKSLWQAARLGS